MTGAKELCVKNINELTEVLPALVVFVQVIESGNFSAAGRELSLTPSSVSRTIARLEARLNVVLFTRSTRALNLTEAGQGIYQQAVSVIAATKKLFSEASSYSDVPKGLLRVTAPNTLGRLLLGAFLPVFLTRYPDINVELDLTDSLINLTGDNYDLALRVTDRPPEDRVARALMPVEYLLVCAQQYAPPLPMQPAQLQDHALFMPGEAQFQSEWHFLQQDVRKSVAITPRLKINNSDAMIDAILQGAGIGLLPTFIANGYLLNGQLRHVLPDWHIENTTPMTAYAITLPNRLLPLKTRVFIEDFMAWLKAK